MRESYNIDRNDAKAVAAVLRHLNTNTSSVEAAELAVACGLPGGQFPELFRRLMVVADILADE